MRTIGRGSTLPTSLRSSSAVIRITAPPGIGWRCHRPCRRREGWPGNGAFIFSFDPYRTALEAPALWCADTASAVVALDRAPPDFPEARPLDERLVPVADRSDFSGRHLVIDRPDRRHRFWMRDPSAGIPLVILFPATRDPVRCAAVEATRRLIAGMPSEPAGAAYRPSLFQRQRLVTLLTILDAALAGLGGREIGTWLLYPWLADINAQAWKASSERRRTQRLIAETRLMMTIGYRHLLSAEAARGRGVTITPP
jgi:hypothetical protein